MMRKRGRRRCSKTREKPLAHIRSRKGSFGNRREWIAEFDRKSRTVERILPSGIPKAFKSRHSKVSITIDIKVGYELIYDCPQPTPMLLMLNIHYSHAYEIVQPDLLVVSPLVPTQTYRDGFGNWCSRLEAPAGRTKISTTAIVRSTGNPEPVVLDARQHPIGELPAETLSFLMGSRYCETDLLTEFAWKEFSHTPLGWSRVQAICDFVHHHLKFDYMQARPTRTAMEAYKERIGVCRDFAHLAITLCRCMNIPARYCTGYVGDLGLPPNSAPMDFAGWFEAFLGGRWYVFDPRNNDIRIGRILIARGRDAVDVAISTTFGPNTLAGFKVIYDEVTSN
jgi:transglutaminase-like putative cysteine protease